MTYEELLRLMQPQLAGGAEGAFPVGAQVEEPPQYLFPQPPLPTQRIGQVQQFEGFNPNAYWDYGQYSIGHGTKSQPGERIDREEAGRRLVSELSSSRAFVNQRFPNVDPGTQDALTSLHFNAGQKWANQGLGAALDQGNLAEAQQRFLGYNKAGGQVLPGLQSRRNVEAQWMGRPMVQGGQLPEWMIPQQAQVPVNAAQESAQLAQQPRVPTIQVPTNPTAEGNVKPGSWTEALQNPSTAAYLRNVGLHLMMGTSWQGGLSGALEIGGRAMNAADEAQYQTEKNQDELFLKGAALDEKNEDRLSRERIARIGAESRQDVANIRGQFSMQRAQAAGAKTPNDLSAYNAVYNTVYKTLTSENLLKPPEQQLTEQQIDGLAAQRAAAQWRTHQSLRGGPAIAGASNSEISAGQTSAGGSQAGAKPPSAGQNEAGDQERGFISRNILGFLNGLDAFSTEAMDAGKLAAPAAAPVEQPKPAAKKPAARPDNVEAGGLLPFDKYIQDPEVAPHLDNPAFRAAVKKRFPAYKKSMEAYEQLLTGAGGF